MTSAAAADRVVHQREPVRAAPTVTPAARFSRCSTPPALRDHRAGDDRAAALRAEDRHARVVRAEREARVHARREHDHVARAEVVGVEDRLHGDAASSATNTLPGSAVTVRRYACGRPGRVVGPADGRQAVRVDREVERRELAAGRADAAAARVAGQRLDELRAVPALRVDPRVRIGVVGVVVIDPREEQLAAARLRASDRASGASVSLTPCFTAPSGPALTHAPPTKVLT